jgi:biotin-(acetyl-CoA carboxylase) ligase
MPLEQIAYTVLNKIFYNYSIWQNEDFSYFKEKINNKIRNKQKVINVSINSSNKPIKGIFLGLGDTGSLQVKVGTIIFDYYSVETISFPLDELP